MFLLSREFLFFYDTFKIPPPFFLASTFSVEKDVISTISGYFKVTYVIFVLWLIFKFYICFDSQTF